MRNIDLRLPNGNDSSPKISLDNNMNKNNQINSFNPMNNKFSMNYSNNNISSINTSNNNFMANDSNNMNSATIIDV